MKRATVPARGSDEDQRRQRALTSLLVGTLVLAVMALGAGLARHLFIRHTPYPNPLIATALVIGLVLVLWQLARRGHYRAGAWTLLGLFFVSGTYVISQWSYELPQGELLYAIVIVLAGVLINARAGMMVAGAVSLLVALLAVLQGQHYLHPDTSWLGDDVELDDVLVYLGAFWVIALASWLSNRELELSLQRVRRSEAALKRSHEQLELQVHERTRQLEETQREQFIELQRFAQFGRFSAGLLHDLANPLTAAWLNVEQLAELRPSAQAREAMKSLQQLERYVEAARNQLQQQSGVKAFALTTELEQVIESLTPKANQARVALRLEGSLRHRLLGDPRKFSRLVANLVANAVDAYSGTPSSRGKRTVVVNAVRDDHAVVLAVQDWGVGIADSELAEIFNPFYSTKQSSGRGIGIGLATVKQIVEDEFGGEIAVTSSATDGTRFVVRLPRGGAGARWQG